LQRSGEETIVRDRHAQAFADIAEASEMGLSGDEQAEWQRRMDRANGDFVVALERSRANRDDDTSLRLVGSLWRWWYTSGRITEGRAWAATALAGSRSASPSRRAKALYTSAILAAENGDYGTAWAHAQSARRSFEAVGDHVGMSRSSTILGNVAKFRGDAAAAVNHLTDAVAGQRMVGDDKATAVALQNLAAFVIDQGGLGHGRALMEDSLALKRRAGDRRSLGYGLINLSDLLVREGSPDEARTALNEAGEIAQTLSDDRLGSFVEHNLGDVAVAAGEDDTAMVHYDLALAGFRRVGDRRDVALALCSLGLALTRAGRRDEGVQRLRESEALAAEIGDEVRLSEARSALTIAEVPSAAGTLPGGLTVRQAEILTLLTTGSSNRNIAQRLALSAGTVERHLANIYQKLGVSNRVGATRYALAHGLGAADVSTERPR
jgi:ATP/maltotriose-dependent transcriptional regulator MalT